MDGVKEITRNGAKFMDGQEKEFSAIILATGYKSNVPTWLKVKKNYLSFRIFTSILRISNSNYSFFLFELFLYFLEGI